MPEADHELTTRLAYDATADLYSQWIGTEISASIEGPLDRAFLAAFIEIVSSGTPGLIADLGCGTGRVTALLAASRLDVIGVDVSPGMLAIARQAHPSLRFEEGRLAALPFADGAVGGAALWYSIIHTPPSELGAVASELARVLAVAAPVVVAFQAGAGEAVHRGEVRGRPVALTNYRHSPDDVARCLDDAGVEVTARLIRDAQGAHEENPQAFLLCRRAGSAAG